MVKWLTQDESNAGTTYTGINNDHRKIKVFVPNDGRQRPRMWQWDRTRKAWIEKITATGGQVKLAPGSKAAWDQSLLPAEPRWVPEWQSIRKTKDGKWIAATPEHTKRHQIEKRIINQGKMRAQRGNKGAAGSV